MPKSAAVAGGSVAAAIVNGAIESGSGSIPSAIWIIVWLPGDRDLVDLAGRHAGLLAHLLRELVERLLGAALQERERIGVEHRRGDARDHVGAEGLLLVQLRLHRERRAGLEVEQVRDDGGRPEIERDREGPPGRVARLDVEQQVVAEHGGHLEVGGAERAAERAHDLHRHPQLDVVHRREHAFEVGELILERRLLELEVALLHRGPQDHVPADADERRLRPRRERRHLDDEVLLRLLRGRRAASPPSARRSRTHAGRRTRAAPSRRRRAPCTSCRSRGRRRSSRSRSRSSSPRRRASSRPERAPPSRARRRRRSARSAAERGPSLARRGRISAALTMPRPPAARGTTRSSARPTRRGRAGGRLPAPRRRTRASARP